MTNTKVSKPSFVVRIWRYVRNFSVVVILFCGFVCGLFTLLLPNEGLYKPYLSELLSELIKKDVSIDHISGKWNGLGPRFLINGMAIKGDEVQIGRAFLNVNLFEYLIPGGATGIYLGINKVEVDFERKQSGEIILSDETQHQESLSSRVEKFLATGTFSVRDLNLNIYDAVLDNTRTINSHIIAKKSDKQRAFAMQLDAQGLADDIQIKVIADENYDLLKQAKWYLQVKELSLDGVGQLINKNILPKAVADAEVWVSTAKGNIVKMLGKAELKKIPGHDQGDISGKLELIYQGTNSDWQAELTIKGIETTMIAQHNIVIELYRQKNIIGINAKALNIPLLKTIANVLNISNEVFDQMTVNGKLMDVQIEYDIDLRRVTSANVDFEQLSVSADFGQFSQLSGGISLKDEQIRLLIDSDEGSAKLPGVIRGEVQWDSLILTAQTSMQDDDLDIKINSLWCDCRDFLIDGAARFRHSDQLFMDLTLAAYKVKANQMYKYWPSIKWKPKILNYLDQALISGVVEKGMIIYHGFVEQFPFANNEGLFITRSDLQGAKIRYHKDWPIGTNFNAMVQTLNRTFSLSSQKGQVLGAQINDVSANIENLKLGMLEIDVNAQGRDNFLLDFLKQSPMAKGLDILNQDINLSGFQKADVSLNIPLKQKNIAVQPQGRVHFIDTDFQMGKFDLKKLNGGLDFQGFSLGMNDLRAQFLQRDVVVSGGIFNHPNQLTSIDVLLQGRYKIEDFEKSMNFSLPASGEAFWDFNITNTDDKPLSFRASSQLLGVTLDTPEPFLKPFDRVAPFLMTCVLPCTGAGWNVTFDDKVESQFTLDLETQDFKLNTLNFGDFDQNFGGQLDVVDVDKWIAFITSGGSKGQSNNLPFDQMSVHINEMIFLSRMLFNVDVTFSKTEDGINFNIQGEDIAGDIMVADDIDRKGVIVQLQKLHWHKLKSNIEVESAASVTSNYPPLHVRIDDFIYDDIPLGAAEIEVRPISDGVMVEKFNTNSDLLSLNINGTWSKGVGEKGLSQFDIIMTSHDIARCMIDLGFEAPITKATTIIDLQAEWADSPSQFAIKDISGQMHIKIGEGEVVDAKPGVGRVLSLFSLTNLPRRLILDFRDVLSKGLRFEGMEGDFIIENGRAHTDSFVIDSASAKIVVSGQTGLADQDYNQTVTVTPRVGRVLPTIGAITGGAVGVAAGLFVQGLFRSDLKKVGKIVYKVTGSWDEPNIELIETEEL